MNFKCHLDPSDLQAYMGKIFGTSYLISGVTNMEGGAQKVVYKIDCRNGFSCMLYVWDLSMNYFQEEIVKGDLHEQSYGSDLFECNNNYLTRQGIRTPALYNLNKERNGYPYDYALVEYIDGQKAEVYFQHADPQVKDQVFQRTGNMVADMHANERDTHGKVNQSGSSAEKCHQVQMKNAKLDLVYACQHMDSIKASYSKLLDTLYELESKIEPRNHYGFIHGELGPDHLLINQQLEPELADHHSRLALRFIER